MKHIHLFIYVGIILVACQSKKSGEDVVLVIPDDEKYFNAIDEITVFDTVKALDVVYKDSITTWRGYHKVTKDLELIRETTPNEVLSSAEDLVKDIELMQDSITVKALKIKGVKARINALYNQSLRLKDMKDIPSIKVSEIIKQTEGLFVIYRMINEKINAVYQQENFEKGLEDGDFFFSKLDSIQ